MISSTKTRDWRTGTLAAAIASTLTLALAGPASAATPRIDCKQTPDACKVASTGQTLSPKAGAARKGRSKCENWTVERWGKSPAGIKLWSWYLDVHWCYRRGRITEASADPRPDTHMPFWSFDKQLAFRQRGGKRKTFYRVYAQGQVQLCVPTFGCIQDAQPWIRFVARGDGSDDYDAGG
jgi:hypothetical protein